MLAESIKELVVGRLRESGTIKFHIYTSCMVPALIPGDHLIVKGVTEKLPEIGSIVMRRYGSTWVAHRLVHLKRSSHGYCPITKGDNVYCADSARDLSNPECIVITVIRGDRKIDLSSTRARLIGRSIASLSFFQAILYQPSPKFFRRLILAGLHRIIIKMTLLFFGST
jgi:hypothetical protein